MTDQRAAQAFDKMIDQLGYALAGLDRLVSANWSGEVEVQGIKLRLGNDTTVETLVVVTGVGVDGTPVVGFHSAAPASQAMAGAVNRLLNGSMKWKVDEYRTGTK